ncbi:putative two-component response regulator [Gordonia polyisoprenivorans NBRC 16320 = JCM 10675]|uniref:Response regulator transcription factor n=1 Tax=Gordonia polyisoprenivorans TaxID=84595 RepID=A0A846WTI7_9ACTN|nr:response regulator transcription factor [Gordonia polyisoprenivorans]NKY04959.1 response regulator transcription factor [Gordonia polyisoprenivorans]OZC32963.1 DNA-binding response regulator [Gordonia polyisoprenivorans]QUD82784.1 response regulator transcription factor [Gordonia polyisoprenivorans]UZF56373.1 response regulator transcription factor [Gordonia polyisoprenivorans]WCB37443.1 response regulator transcription factor [Gordonia polyisoprenivorans]
MIRVLIAEDSAILRDTLVAVLDLEEDLAVVAAVATGPEIVPAALERSPDVAVLDIDLPGTDGLTAAGRLATALPTCRVLILTAHARPANLRAALDAHVAGFLAKDTSARELIAAIRTIAAGGRVVDPDAAIAAISTRPSPLTARETEVLRLHAKGANPRDIANTLFLSYGTVRNYLASATDKLGARNRTDAAIIAGERGWL